MGWVRTIALFLGGDTAHAIDLSEGHTPSAASHIIRLGSVMLSAGIKVIISKTMTIVR